MPVPTKEDLLAALGQLQAQPKSPYELQFEAPVIAGPEPSREQQFQQDWDTAMQAYQARVASPRILPPGITYGGQGGNLDTPELAAQATLAPLRFQAAEFSPGVARQFSEQDLEKLRQEQIGAQASHWKALEAAANQRLRSDFMAKQFRESEARDRLAAQQAKSDAELALRRRALDLRERIAAQNNFGMEQPAAPQQEEDVSQIPTDQIIAGLRSMPRTSRPIPAATDVVPNDKSKRVVGQRYVLPNGTYTWTGTGWTQ